MAFRNWPLESREDEDKAWKKCIGAIDEANHRLNRNERNQIYRCTCTNTNFFNVICFFHLYMCSQVVYVTTVTDKNITSTNCITNKTCITLPIEVIISQKQTITNIVRDRGLLFSALGCQCWCSKLVPSLFILTAVDSRVLVAVVHFRARTRINCTCTRTRQHQPRCLAPSRVQATRAQIDSSTLPYASNLLASRLRAHKST